MLLFIGCEEPLDKNSKTFAFQFYCKNASPKQVNIYLFISNNDLFKSFKIDTSDSVLMDEGIINPVSGSTYYLTSTFIDSAVIIFSDGKQLIQKFYNRENNDIINNILSNNHYLSIFPKEERIKKALFILTEKDYNRAK